MWNGLELKNWFWLLRIPRQWCQHYLSRCLLLDHWSSLFNDKTWIYSNMYLAFVWNRKQIRKAQQENQNGLTKEDEGVPRAFKMCILQALKLELNLSSNPDATGPIQERTCPFHYILSEKASEMWSAQPLLPLARINPCLQIKSEILVLNCLGALLWRSHWPLSAELETAALRSVRLFFFGCQCHQRLPLAVLFCALETENLPQIPHEAFHSGAVWQCRFFFNY